MQAKAIIRKSLLGAGLSTIVTVAMLVCGTTVCDYYKFSEMRPVPIALFVAAQFVLALALNLGWLTISKSAETRTPSWRLFRYVCVTFAVLSAEVLFIGEFGRCLFRFSSGASLALLGS